ncbi:electron transfer flavoprotein subunit alpha/FixB family protein [Fusobacterium massiliense]|jgi:electron transfer flavoprotein, alpha subunit|uniref:electron transfer flavoprotein subunit alpha/FixB family protein n=1 Tax=Fusobacterium massiliense TaxID=1852365 RepID=UPI00093C0789|nr:electron transfer flavoprotein subunit alpha/FixB family protein [Fusobacterium massiliense]
MNLNDYKGILVYAEQREGVLQNVGLELLGKATELAHDINKQLALKESGDELSEFSGKQETAFNTIDVVAATLEEDEEMTAKIAGIKANHPDAAKVTAVLIGHDVKNLAQELVEFGADKVLVVDRPELKLFDTEAYTQVLNSVITTEKPEIVLFGATTLGRDLAPRVSSRLATGLTADCTKLELLKDKERQLGMTRPAFGGNLMATIVSPDHRPQMATVRPGVMKKIAKLEGREGQIVDFSVELDTSKLKVKVLEVVKEGGNKVDISEAKILVSGGRGVGAKQNFELLEDLAKEIGGIVSSSRAQVDAGNMPHDRQVGQTGKTVRPEVYFACGISGAIQHVAGMEESEFIIAINKDRFAPIFSVADLGIVGDLHKILPILTEEIKKYKATK